MRGGEVHILHLFRRTHEPALLRDLDIFFLIRHRLRSHQVSPSVVQGDCLEIVLVRLIQKIHPCPYSLLLTGKIIFLYYVVIHCVRYLPHADQIVL